MAKSLIEQVISVENEKAAARVSGGVDGPAGIGFQSAPTGSFEMMIPGNLVARIIGKGGEVIKALQLETGAKIVIIQDSREYALEKPLRITGKFMINKYYAITQREGAWHKNRSNATQLIRQYHESVNTMNPSIP